MWTHPHCEGPPAARECRDRVRAGARHRCTRSVMPGLSENELKILREIEAQLSATDPQLVDTVSRTTVYRHALRAIRWAIVGFVVGLVVVVLTFTSNIALAFAGFLGMLFALWPIATNLKKIGKAGLHSIFGIREGGLRSLFGDTGRGLRERFRRNDS